MKNWFIIGVAKAMIHDQDLFMFLWLEACNTTVNQFSTTNGKSCQNNTIIPS
jgi:hypothetical protein